LRTLGTIAKWLFILCLPILLLTATIGAGANSLWLYKHSAEKYGVSQALASAGLELSDSELEQVYAGLISYFNSDEEYISLTVVKDDKPLNLFTPEETIHLKDAKGLIWLDYWFLLGTLVYVLAYAGASLARRNRRQLALGLVWSGSLTLGLILALVLLDTLYGFSRLFYNFHLLFFTNEFWAARGYMLLLYPEGFFIDGATFGLLVMAGLAIILGGVGGWYLIFSRRKTPAAAPHP
jgi:integral membrane protein (TIGR01906 family)